MFKLFCVSARSFTFQNIFHFGITNSYDLISELILKENLRKKYRRLTEIYVYSLPFLLRHIYVHLLWNRNTFRSFERIFKTGLAVKQHIYIYDTLHETSIKFQIRYEKSAFKLLTNLMIFCINIYYVNNVITCEMVYYVKKKDLGQNKLVVAIYKSL